MTKYPPSFISIKIRVPDDMPDLLKRLKIAAINKDMPLGQWLLEAIMVKLAADLRAKQIAAQHKKGFLSIKLPVPRMDPKK